MTSRAVGCLMLILVLGGCGTDGAEQFGGDPPDAEATFGSCAFCHHDRAVNMTRTGGHESLDRKCQFCHEDLLPGEAGDGHRGVPVCTDCHTEQEIHYDREEGTADQCFVCHTPHGSGNLFLVRETLTTPDGRTGPIDFKNELGKADGSFASETRPGSGICEVCHLSTLHYRSDGSGVEHLTLACTACHRHTAGFRP